MASLYLQYKIPSLFRAYISNFTLLIRELNIYRMLSFFAFFLTDNNPFDLLRNRISIG